MSLIIRNGRGEVLANFTEGAQEYREPPDNAAVYDFILARTAQGRIEARAPGGAVFLCVDFDLRVCEVNVTSWSHVDVGERKRKKELAAATMTVGEPKKRKRATNSDDNKGKEKMRKVDVPPTAPVDYSQMKEWDEVKE